MKHIRTIALCGLLLSIATGCREQYKHLTFQPTEAPMQTIESIGPTDQAVTAAQMTSIEKLDTVPYTYHLLPASERKAVFDTLLGTSRDVYFLQEPGGETLVAFDGRDNTPARIAQACRIGNEKSSVLVLLGMSGLPQESPGVKVYTFEKGRAASAKPYQAGKDHFLEQFQNCQVITRPKDIQGITGATPIWKSVAEQVRNSYALLLKDKTDAAWIAGLKDTGKIWHRGNQEVTDSKPTPAGPQEAATASAEQLDSASSELPAAETQSQPESYAFTEDNILMVDSESELLYEHWETVATAEISLLVCGVLIVTVTQIKRMIYQ